jgi:hypothetical protein
MYAFLIDIPVTGGQLVYIFRQYSYSCGGHLYTFLFGNPVRGGDLSFFNGICIAGGSL